MSSEFDDAGVYRVAPSAWRIQDLPERLRPREEMDRVGAENLTDAMLIAILLGSGTRGVNVVDLAGHLVAKYGTLTQLAAAPVSELVRDPDLKGMGPARAKALKCALEIGRRLSEETLPERFAIRAPAHAARVLRERCRTLEREVFWVLHLDTKNRLMGHPRVVTEGILDASLVHPREVFREAVRNQAAAVVLAHNHPSGDPTPSAEDVRVTRQLVEAGRVVDIRVMDHVVMGRGNGTVGQDFVSMRESGVVAFSE